MAEISSAYFIEGIFKGRERYGARVRGMPLCDEVDVYRERKPINLFGLKIPRGKEYIGRVFISKNNGTEIWEIEASRDNFSKLVDLIGRHTGTFHATITERRV